jgi:hypothetical protein
MTRLGIRAAAIVAAAFMLTGSAAVAAPKAPPAPHVLSATGHLVPVAVAPPGLISTELGAYAAFPVAVRTADGVLAAYGVNTSHYGATGRTYLRRSGDGAVWGEPFPVPDQATGYAWGTAGLAAETAAQGGRIYATEVRTGWVPNSQTLSSVAGYVRYSDDNAATWSPLVAMPGAGPHPGGWQYYPSSAVVMPDDGEVVQAGYGSDDHVHVYSSIDRGATWAPAGNLSTAGRQLEEPQLCAMSGGRLAVVMRSDGVGTDASARLYLAVRDAAGMWGAPKVITYDGSGSPACAEVAPGTLAIAYRGWIDRADATKRPLRVLMVAVDSGWGRGNIDLAPGVWGRFLYGSWLRDPADSSTWRLIYALEGPNGSTAPAAQVWSVPVHFSEITS